MNFITSRDNENIKSTIKLKTNAKQRRKAGAFIAEGVRICMDAMRSKSHISIFFATENAREKHRDEFKKISEYANETYIVTKPLFALMSDTETPQGFLCVIKALDKIIQFDTINKNSRFVALDNVQDPSNLGTILRTAEAFGVSGVVLSADCCDVYSPKVVRGSMGAVFRLPFTVKDSIRDFLLDNKQLASFAAVVDSNAQSVSDTDFSAPCVSVIGNEGSGLKPETIECCKTKITIPMKGNAESLNASAAASIIMWEMMK